MLLQNVPNGLLLSYRP